MKIIDMCRTVVFLLTFVLLSACNSDDDPIVPVSDAPSTITTFRLLLFPDLAQPFQISYRDIDDDGPADPIIMSGTLFANRLHEAELSLFDETVVPETDINDVIEADGTNYQIFYVGNGIDFDLVYKDEDINGNPIGLLTDITTNGPGTGSLTIIVRHLPTKNASGDPVAAGGTTVAEVTIPVDIQ